MPFKLIFASMFDPANPHFCSTLLRFLSILLIQADRSKNAFKVIFELQKAPKIDQKSQKISEKNQLENDVGKTTDFLSIFALKLPQKLNKKSSKIDKIAMRTLTLSTS